MKLIFLLLLVILSLSNAKGQQFDPVVYKTAHVILNVIVNNKQEYEHGTGFIINGKYVATCYHVYLTEPNARLTSIKILYNYKYYKDGRKSTYDSVDATIDYEPNKNQYNFKNHSYKKGERNTDFVILKLKHPVKSEPIAFDTSEIKVFDLFYLVKYHLIARIKEPEVAVSEIRVFAGNGGSATEETLTQYDALINKPAGDGYSGSPIFNSKGLIVGMMHSGGGNAASIVDAQRFKAAGLDGRVIDRVIATLTSNPQTSMIHFTSIKYLIGKYMKGYL